MEQIRRKGVWVFLLLFLCHAIAVLLFCKGFLLRRVVIPEYSNCTQKYWSGLHAAEEKEEVGNGPCSVYPRKFKRVVWLLVDALRYDFAEYESTLEPVPVYRNKLPYIHHLLTEKPHNAKLFRFIADPPTTTMQRLKALTTGSLPTFIDIGSNFNSHRIMEDSLPFQANATGRNITFMGDDTWLGLYEGMLAKVFDYPSLNVQDLHTVDNGVVEHMVPELKKEDADFIIGHFLGVDHVGHTYGSTHWTMGEKLTQINGILESILGALDNDTIVFVFGDHGMTESGDHGGETELETTAALLVYTPRPMFYPGQHSVRSLYQIDIVPTVSLLLGMPIPFSNLGMIIPEVFLPWSIEEDDSRRGYLEEERDGYKGRVTSDYLSALKINAKQMQMYLKTYVRHAEDFPSDVYMSLQERLAHAEKLHDHLGTQRRANQTVLTDVASIYVEYMQDVKRMCRNVWAKFEDTAISQGIVLFSLTLCVNLLTILNSDLSMQCMQKSLPAAFGLGTLTSLFTLMLSPLPIEIGLNSVFDLLLSLSFYPLLVFLLLHIFFMHHQIYQFFKRAFLSIVTLSFIDQVPFTYILSILVAVFSSMSLLSNSFILYEADMTVFFIQSLLICFIVQRLNIHHRQMTTGKMQVSEQSSSLDLLSALKVSWPLLLAMVVVRLTKTFHACRDLQVGCVATSFLQPYHVAVESLGMLADLRLFFSCISILSVPVALTVYVYWNGSHRHMSYWLLFCVYCALPISSLCIGGFWYFQSLSQSTLALLPYWQHVLLPRAVYVLCGSTLLVCSVTSVGKPRREQPLRSENDSQEENSIVTVYTTEDVRRRVVLSHDLPDESIQQVKPASNEQTSPISIKRNLTLIILLVALWLPIALVLNDGIALSAVLLVIQVSSIIWALSDSQETSWPVVVLWGLLSSQGFFGFGHHPTVVSLRFEAGFVGLHGEMSGLNLLFAGLLVGINMLGSQILLGISLPMLLTVVKREKMAVPSERLLTIGLQYIAVNSMKALVAMLTASLQRRHLMVWGVFSPRFLYEAAFQAVTDCCVLLTYFFTSFILNINTQI